MSKAKMVLAEEGPRGKQGKAVRAWFSHDHDIVALCGQNRSGKSYIAAAMYIEDLVENAPIDSFHFAVTVNVDVSRGGQQKYFNQFVPAPLLGRFQWSSRNGYGSDNPLLIIDERTKDNPDGRNITVYFRTESQYYNNMRSFEAVTIDSCWIDESVSQEVYSAIKRGLTSSRWHGQTLMSTIPSATWMYYNIKRADESDRVYYDEFEWQDNPTMTKEKWDALMKSVPDYLRGLRAGTFQVLGELVYPEFDEDKHIIPHDKVPKDLTWFLTIDPGMDHPTACLLVGVAKAGNVYIYDEFTSRNQTPEEDAGPIRIMIGDREIEYGVIDPRAYNITKANPVSVGEQYELAGIDISPGLQTTTHSENVGIHMIKEMLRHGQLFVTDSCKLLIDNFNKWSYKRNTHGKPLEHDTRRDSDNDALDALRYLLMLEPTYGKTKIEVGACDEF